MKNYALSLTSAFSTTSLLKARILMLYRKPSAKFALAKFGFALPALALCVLITAFTQRERILPASLLAETNAVAQRLTQEVQKAFLPAVATPTVADRQARQEVLKSDEIVTENEILPTQDMVEKPTMLSIIQSKNVAWQASEATVKTNLSAVIMPVDSVKKAKKKRKHLPFFVGEYGYFTQKELKSNEAVSISKIFEKDKIYLIQFYNAKEKVKLNTSMEIDILQGGKNVEISKTEKGYTFTPSHTRAHEIKLKNLNKNIRVIAMIYAYDKTKENPSIELKCKDGSSINGFKPKVNLNQNFQLVFSRTADYTELAIHEVLVTVHRTNKAIVFEKVYKTPNFNLSDLQVQKDDIVRIQVTEFSGKLNGITVQNPKTGYGFLRNDPIFSIQPKIK